MITLVDVSLLVNVWVVDEADPDKVRILEVPEGDSELAGFERTRTELWNLPAVRSLGAVFLPRLADGDLWVGNGEVKTFAAECALLLANRTAIASASGYGEDYLQVRLTNMANAARRALHAGGGVVVW